MVESNPPLFVHDGIYSAKLDRALIGGLLIASGDTNYQTVPRSGVRPQYVDDAGNETSLRVVATGSSIAVQPGAAFIKGSDQDGLSAVYLIISPNPYPVSLPPPTPAQQTVIVAIMVTDSFGDPSPDPAEGSWRIGYYAGPPPTGSIFLPLAQVTIPANGGNLPAPTDKRQFATGLGGSLLVPFKSTLSGAPLQHMPYGTLAYAWDTDMMYMRSKNGWVQNPAVATLSDTASNQGIVGHQNELLWNTTQQVLYIYDKSQWLAIMRRPASVQTAYESTFPNGPDRAQTSAISMDISVEAGTYYSIEHDKVKPVAEEDIKPEEESLTLQVMQHSSNAIFSIRMKAKVTIQKKDAEGNLVEDKENQFWIGVQIFKPPATFRDPLAEDKTLKPFPKPENDSRNLEVDEAQAVDEVKSSLSWTTVFDEKTFTMDVADVPQGLWCVRPLFKANKLGYFKIENLFIEVVSR